MKKIVAVLLILLTLFPLSVFVMAGKKDREDGSMQKAETFFASPDISSNPCQKPDGSPFTFCYVDIDPYPASGEMLYYFIKQLEETGWITCPEELPFDPENTDAKELINYLAEKDTGKYLKFRSDANYYIAVDDREACKASILEHVRRQDIDLIFCMGTSPAEMVVKEMGITEVPVMVYFSVDPVGAGLSENEEFSGKENVFCHTSSEVYTNQMQFYHRAYPFKNIGMVYYSESVAAMNKYREAAEKIGFSITERKTDTISNVENKEESEKYYQNLSEIYKELIEKENIDAFMLNTDMIKDTGRIADMLDIFYQNKIPVFVQNGEYYVEYGALMVVTASDAKTQAPFAVTAMAQILNGKKPGEIYEKFIPSPYLTINLQCAKRLGYDVPEEFLLSAEKLYTKTKR